MSVSQDRHKGDATSIRTPGPILPLSPSRKRELEALYRSAADGRVRIRALIVLLAADQHRSISEIAEVVRYHDETVRRWLFRYLNGGVQRLHDAPKSGAPPKLTVQHRQEAARVLEQAPGDLGLPYARWTGRRLAEYLLVQFGVQISLSSVYRLMREQDLKTPKTGAGSRSSS